VVQSDEGQDVGEPWIRSFHDLMLHRVREILLVSSAYDAFVLEEDGRLTERLFLEYSELNLSSAPRITHARTAKKALELLAERRFDLVLTTARLEDPGFESFSREVKERYPGLPVVLLTFDEAELRRRGGGRPLSRSPDHRVFLWSGDAKILLPIIKLAEDALNVASDTRIAGVQVILVVEDSPRRYSTFLALLYSELMTQSQSLVAEGVNDLHRLLRMRARPKILLATSFEEAIHCARRYRDFLLALISDVSFPRSGQEDPEAGFALLDAVRQLSPRLPVLLQSAEPANAARAAELGAHYVDKNSPRLLRRIRGFLKETLGFGDFVFRLPDRTVVARARDLYEMQQVLRGVPAESLYFHAAHDHFNVWLRARSMFRLADLVREVRVTDFADVEDLRRFLLGVLDRAALQEQEGVLADFSSRAAAQRRFVRLGKGSTGGKGRGLAFVHSMLARHNLRDRFPGLSIRVPRTVVLGSDEFDRFLEANLLAEPALGPGEDRETLRRFLEAPLPEDLIGSLHAATRDLKGPLAVRSSSLLEDSQHRSCAGIYATYVLPNQHPDPLVRLTELGRAIRAVYASTFSAKARAYLASSLSSVEEEKMAVVIQQLAGQRHGERFYPRISGVALSYNYYPIGPQKREDGIALVALGLGHRIVQGGDVLRFCPSSPGIRPQMDSLPEFLRTSQSRFHALDLSRSEVDFAEGADASLGVYELDAAEADGTLEWAGSVYCADDDRLRDTLDRPGPRLVTFNNVLKWNAVPLAPALAELLPIFREGMGCPVEIEFAVERIGAEPCLVLLQIRPLAGQAFDENVEAGGFPPEQVWCRSGHSLGHGVIRDLRDIVQVKRRDLPPAAMASVAAQVGAFDARLQAERAPYLLLGPGRWGSSDPSLGIPVDASQIAGARVIVETPFRDRRVEPSQGSHFFHNITSLRIGYVCLADGADFLDWDWLARQPTCSETPEVRHMRLVEPLRVVLDGREGKAAFLKPGVG
jgi:pyruvate phosphate dikinase-like enzyme